MSNLRPYLHFYYPSLFVAILFMVLVGWLYNRGKRRVAFALLSGAMGGATFCFEMFYAPMQDEDGRQGVEFCRIVSETVRPFGDTFVITKSENGVQINISSERTNEKLLVWM